MKKLEKPPIVNQTYSIITFGCTFNLADSLKIENILTKHSFRKVDQKKSEIMIINTCAVKHATEAKIVSLIKKQIVSFPEKHFIITGCLPQINTELENDLVNLIGERGFILHPHEIFCVYEKILQKFLDKKKEIFFPDNYRDKSSLFPIIHNHLQPGIIQISEGCNNSCAYCCTRIARGSLVSFNFEDILHQIKSLYSMGIKEFHLTSEDLGNYNYKGKELHDLLEEISNIKGEMHFRLGMLNPDYLAANLTNYLKIFEDKRFFRFIHVPIQSASNDVLQKMRRNYNIETVEKIINRIKLFDENFTFSTDIITGFPTETQSDHEKTINFIQKWRPRVLNISKYSVRPNTEAKRMKQLKSQVIKDRSRDFSKIYNEYLGNLNEEWINWEGDVFFNKYQKNLEYPFGGRNLYYLPIISGQGILGLSRKVKIVDALNHSLIGI